MSKLLKSIIVSSAILTSFTAKADTLYVYSQNTGNLYTVNTNTNTTNLVGGVSAGFLSTVAGLSTSTNIDITYFGGYVYGLASGFGGNTAIFRIDPATGQEDSTYGVSGIMQVEYPSGTDLTAYAAEGITNNGNDLVISYASQTNASASTLIRQVNVSTGRMFGGALDTTTLPSSTSTPTTLDLRDVDGLGRCGARLVNVNTSPSLSRVDISDLGQPGSWSFDLMASVSNSTTPPKFYDIAFYGGSNLAVAGSLSSGDELHLYSVSGSTATLVNSITLPSGEDVRSVASNGEANCAIPTQVENPMSNYQCYDLMDHEIETYDSQISKDVIDQFAQTNIRIGHPVSLCNPVDLEGAAIPAEEDHLVCYELFSEDPSPDRFDVEIVNEIETNQLTTGHADEICLVSSKTHL